MWKQIFKTFFLANKVKLVIHLNYVDKRRNTSDNYLSWFDVGDPFSLSSQGHRQESSVHQNLLLLFC